MKYHEYVMARDAAWRALIQFKVQELPVKVSGICKKCGFSLRSYTKGARQIFEFGLLEQCRISDGFTVFKGGQYFIFYNEKMVVGRIRFTIAHELGHIILGHLKVGNWVTRRNKEPSKEDTPNEHAANVFASRLLAPACVLHAIGALTPETISNVCDISMQSAKYRVERMETLETRNRFGRSRLERQVRNQFDKFTIQRKK